MWMLLTILLMSPWRFAQAQRCISSYSKTSLKLQGHMIKSMTSIYDSFQCINECEFHGNCHSINFDLDKRICELNDANHLSFPESLVYSHGSLYINYHIRPVSKCSNNLCRKPLECEMLNDGVNFKCKSGFEVMNFPRKSAKDYVILENAFDNLTAVTVALWVQADPSTSDHTPFSYATKSRYNEIAMYPNVNVVNNEFSFVDMPYKNIPNTIIDGKWHHLCMTWENAQGNLKLYVDGLLVSSVSAVKIGHVIPKGAIVLGQDQDSYKGGFGDIESLQGNLTSVNMWDKVLTAQEISVLAKSCEDEAVGNIVKWSDLKDKGEGAVKLIRGSSCK